LKPVPYEYQSIRSQLIRATISTPLNIAEGNGRYSLKEKTNFYRIAKGSAFECIPLFDIFYQLNIINKDKRKEFRGEIEEITKMISGLIKYHK
jgi:four helix bundle protein